MSTTHKTDRTVAALKHAKKATGGARGNMTKAEISPLLFHARKAFDAQLAAGLLDDGETFNTWRHAQVMAAVGKPGLTACSHEDFRPLRAHFFTLAGRDAEAFRDHLTSGPTSDHAAPGDTHEARRQLAHGIAEILTAHLHLAETSIDQLVAESAHEWHRLNAADYPGPDPVWLADLAARKAAIDAHERGPITLGYVLHIVRMKTRRPDLTLGHDWQAGLSDRLTLRQLTGLRTTLVNRINALEGLGSKATRNKSQRRPSAR